LNEFYCNSHILNEEYGRFVRFRRMARVCRVAKTGSGPVVTGAVGRGLPPLRHDFTGTVLCVVENMVYD
jgi:hypothetical protein